MMEEDKPKGIHQSHQKHLKALMRWTKLSAGPVTVSEAVELLMREAEIGNKTAYRAIESWVGEGRLRYVPPPFITGEKGRPPKWISWTEPGNVGIAILPEMRRRIKSRLDSASIEPFENYLEDIPEGAGIVGPEATLAVETILRELEAFIGPYKEAIRHHERRWFMVAFEQHKGTTRWVWDRLGMVYGYPDDIVDHYDEKTGKWVNISSGKATPVE